MAAAGAEQHSSTAVLSLLQGTAHSKDLLHTEKEFFGRFDDQFITLCDAAKLAEKLHDEAKVKELRSQTEKLVQAQSRLQQHQQALAHVKNTYQCTADATDFEAQLGQRAGHGAASELEKRLSDFDRAVWNVHHTGEPMPGEDEDGVWVGTQDELATNARCPLTLKPILELLDPVRDQHNYVYERAEIESYIRGKSRNGQNGAVDNPNVGATYKLSLSDLQPAKHVVRAAKRRQQLAASQGRAVGSAEHEDHEVID